jgi:hypothetical protein
MTDLLKILDANLPYVLSCGLPLVFVIVDGTLKRFIADADMNLVGADMALCGCTTILGALCSQLLNSQVSGRPVVYAILMTIAAFIVWIFCLLMGRSESRGVALFSCALSTVTFSFCFAVAWHVLGLNP